MDLDNVMLAVAVGVGAWLLMRFRPRRRRPPAPPAPTPEPSSTATMPRVGKPGTVSRPQIKALQQNYLPVDSGWSWEEAALILDALAYLRAACQRVTVAEAPEAVQNALLHFILARDDLREHVRQWAQGRRRNRRQVYLQAGPADLPESPDRDAVTAEAGRLLAGGAPEQPQS